MLDQNATLPIQHGGNQSAIRTRLKLGNLPLLDFSAPLNGLGPPVGALNAVRRATESIGRYPEPGAPRLVHRLAEFHGVPAENILVGAGTTELISLIGQAFREDILASSRALGDLEIALSHLQEPTYGEYRRTAAQNGLRTHVHDAPILGWDQDFPHDARAGIVWTGHPNNPTGRAWERDRLLELIERTPKNGLTIVDEAYLPFFPDEADRTVVPEAVARGDLIVLRSMTKIYAIPGMRIGYAIASPEILGRIKRFLPPWSVTTAAEHAAIASVDDREYLARTIDLIRMESARMTDKIWDIPGLRPAWPGRDRPSTAPPMANFVLVSLVGTPWTSHRLQDCMARRGFLVRECSNYEGLEPGGIVTGPNGLAFETRGHVRLTVRTPGENDLMLATLRETIKTQPPAS